MDLMMPGLNGFEATRRLKADRATRSIPVLALTSSLTADDRQQAAQAGFDAFLAKPVDLAELLHHLRHHLGAA
jgi:CheY-like chemotaxis protein